MDDAVVSVRDISDPMQRCLLCCKLLVFHQPCFTLCCLIIFLVSFAIVAAGARVKIKTLFSCRESVFFLFLFFELVCQYGPEAAVSAFSQNGLETTICDFPPGLGMDLEWNFLIVLFPNGPETTLSDFSSGWLWKDNFWFFSQEMALKRHFLIFFGMVLK